jgi:putative transposase
MDPLPQRHRPAHGVRVESATPTIVFITACTRDRQPWLASAHVHDLLRSAWASATAWQVGRYVIMPDHVHLFAAPGEPELPLESWMKFWKSLVRQQGGDALGRWQPGHWDRRLRSDERYAEKWDYVRNNPVRHGLVSDADRWPYQGEIHELRW